MKLINPRTKELEADIVNFLNLVDESAHLFQQAIQSYFDGRVEDFERDTKFISDKEHLADDLRRDIKFRIYAHMLIPDFRGDVLGLLESVDNVIDTMKKVSRSFSIETPIVYPFLKDDFINLSCVCVETVLEVTKAARAYFTDFRKINEHLNRVIAMERDADAIEERLKRKAFASEEITVFSRKVHMRYFAQRIALISDNAQELAERLAIIAIKRSL